MKDIDQRISIIAKACNDKKGFDIKILSLKKLTPMTDYFIIASGNSITQTVAIADEVEEKMESAGYHLLGKEGYQAGKWILLDFGDIVVHVFYKKDREYYNLENLWADSEEVKLD